MRSATWFGRRSKTVSSSWFRGHVLPADRDDWDDLEADLLSDPDQRQRIAELAADLTVSGFENPVTVRRDRWWHRRPRVRDGIHRSVAAMRLGIDIPVRFGEPEMEGYGVMDEYTVTPAVPVADDSGELLDRVLSLSSFRSADGFWMRCDTASGNRATGEVRLCLPSRPHRREEIAAELTERLREAGIDAAVAFNEEV